MKHGNSGEDKDEIFATVFIIQANSPLSVRCGSERFMLYFARGLDLAASPSTNLGDDNRDFFAQPNCHGMGKGRFQGHRSLCHGDGDACGRSRLD
jgi:hypothetical protein